LDIKPVIERLPIKWDVIMLAPSVWNILLTFEFCNAKPIWIPETRNSCSKFARNLIYAFPLS
jgi:hypothetical protein